MLSFELLSLPLTGQTKSISAALNEKIMTLCPDGKDLVQQSLSLEWIYSEMRVL